MTFDEIKAKYESSEFNLNQTQYELKNRESELFVILASESTPLKLDFDSEADFKESLELEKAYLENKNIDRINDELISCRKLYNEIERTKESGNLELLLAKLLIARQENNTSEITRIKSEVKKLIENQISVLQATLDKILNDE